MAIGDFSEIELRAEIARREKERHEEQEARSQAALRRFVSWLRINVEELLKISYHSRTSCSDSNPINEHRGCSRCALLDFKERPDWSWIENRLRDGTEEIPELVGVLWDGNFSAFLDELSPPENAR